MVDFQQHDYIQGFTGIYSTTKVHVLIISGNRNRSISQNNLNSINSAVVETMIKRATLACYVSESITNSDRREFCYHWWNQAPIAHASRDTLARLLRTRVS